jgi:hypothetical protein
MRSIFAVNDPGRLSASILESIFPSLMSPALDGLAGLFAQFKSDGPPGVFLSDRCSIRRAPSGFDILDADGDDVTATKFAVDRQIEHGKVASVAFDLKLRPDRPDVLGSQWRLRSRQLSLIPRHPRLACWVRTPFDLAWPYSSARLQRTSSMSHGLCRRNQVGFRTRSDLASRSAAKGLSRSSSRPEEFYLRTLPEPCMTLSSQTAPDVRPLP